MSIKINDKKKTIEVTKSFLKAASIFGSDDYKEYQAAKKDNPGYRVVTKSHRTASTNSVPNLSYEDMEKYIIAHDDDGSIMKEYLDLRGLSDEAAELGVKSEHYAEILTWFKEKFPAYAAFIEKRNERIKEAKEAAKAKKEAAIREKRKAEVKRIADKQEKFRLDRKPAAKDEPALETGMGKIIEIAERR